MERVSILSAVPISAVMVVIVASVKIINFDGGIRSQLQSLDQQFHPSLILS